VNVQYLANQIKLQTSENFDLGLRYNNKRFYVAPAFFFSEYHNRIISFYDPAVSQTLNQSVGTTIVYGPELEVGVNPREDLTVFGSFSFDKSEIRDNFQTAANTFVQAKGKQVPDTPEVLAKLGLTYNLYGVEITPIAKFVDTRYGDAMNTQEVPHYWLVDLYVKYKLPPFLGLKNVTAEFSAFNLLNEQYVSTIQSSDNSTAGSYGLGAPRTLVGTISAKY
jgi:iron complex outermembrane receptor protein